LDLYTQWFLRYGFPQHLYCDRGTAFNNALMKELTAMVGTKMHLAMTAHPQGNSIVERRHRSLQRVLNVHQETCGVETDTDIQLALAHAEMIINMVPNREGFSVYARVYGMSAPIFPYAQIGSSPDDEEDAPPSKHDLINNIKKTTDKLTALYNLHKDERAKENELQACQPHITNQGSLKMREEVKPGDMVWLQGRQQAPVQEVFRDDSGKVRGVIAGGSTWSLDNISPVGRETACSLPALPRMRISHLKTGDYILYKQGPTAGVAKITGIPHNDETVKAQPMDLQASNHFYPVWTTL
ncbi:zinc finger, CCHC domain containing 12, partial [Perkinsus chesapeaki]